MTTSFNGVMMETACKILGKQHRKTQPWATDDILEMCDTCKNLKKTRNTTGAAKYKKKSPKRLGKA